MYRLLKLHKLYPMRAPLISSPLSNQYSIRTCVHCEHNFSLKPKNFGLQNRGILQSRYVSTKTRSVYLSNLKTKKRKKTTKKYAELLEVTGNSSSETRASVSNLKPKHLSLLVAQPNISLAQLYNLKKTKSKVLKREVTSSVILDTSKQVSDLAEPPVVVVGNKYNLENLNDDYSASSNSALLDELTSLHGKKALMLEDIDIHPLDHDLVGSDLGHHLSDDLGGKDVEEMFLLEGSHVESMPITHTKAVNDLFEKEPFTTLSSKNKLSYKKTEREQMAKVKQTELDRAGREESLACSLHSYINICIDCGMANRALATLSFYRYRNKRYSNAPRVTDIRLYNLLLHAYAGKSNILKVKEILHILREEQISLSAQSYAACFECAGRSTDSTNASQLLNSTFKDLTEKGFSLNDLMEHCHFITDQREVVLRVIRQIQPGFEPNIPPPDICYSCNLIQDLNRSPDSEAILRYKSPAEGVVSSEQIREFAKEQISTEMKDYIKVKTIEKRSEPDETILYYRTKLKETQQEWDRTITEAFQRDLAAFRAQHQSMKSLRHLNLYPYLRALDPQQYTDIIMQEIRKLAEGSETFSPTLNQLYRELGNQVRTRYQKKFKISSGIMDKVDRLYKDYCDWYLNPADSSSLNSRQHWQELVYLNQSGPTVDIDEKQWPSTVLVGIGRFLYNIIMRDIKINVNVTKAHKKSKHLLPAFYTLFRTEGRLLKEEMKPHPVLSRLFRGAAQEHLVFPVSSVPMMSPPLPWSSMTSGGYVVTKADIIRLPQQAVQQWQRLTETPKPQLYPVLDSLNQLGAVPWIVNKQVLQVVTEVFNSGGSHRLDIPEPPSACPPPDAIAPEMNKQERYQAYRNRMALRRRKAEMYGLWCDALYRLSLAHHFCDRIFWLPHNMDFRGRVYPCPPHLNHLGSDMARSILSFAKGEPLGPYGLDWLKIHLVNLTGLKKRDPISKRLDFANEHMEDIIDSAEKPLTGRMWWAESDEPWQTLACCMEIRQALLSGDEENYVCHFPVHQDGSCNGLQHYAALGRDKVGAESVNLTPAAQPQDVYSRVAALVERERCKDAAAGLKVAEVLDGFIRRKVIKQTVMTTVYGVTRFGARIQIARQLRDIDNFPREFVWSGSTYLVEKTFGSLQEMFTSTKEIQDWFTECARVISQVCGQNVEWVTPLGLPVVQPYNRFNKKFETREKDSNRLQEHYSMDMFERPNVMKQKNAFPPNFIHSLDSSHMMLTSLYCERKGISFVSVHDCYWTHPSSVGIMNKVCREQFVSLHSQPILEELSSFLVKKYSYADEDLSDDTSWINLSKRRLNLVLKQLPSTGDFNIKSVLDSVYFFS